MIVKNQYRKDLSILDRAQIILTLAFDGSFVCVAYTRVQSIDPAEDTGWRTTREHAGDGSLSEDEILVDEWMIFTKSRCQNSWKYSRAKYQESMERKEREKDNGGSGDEAKKRISPQSSDAGSSVSGSTGSGPSAVVLAANGTGSYSHSHGGHTHSHGISQGMHSSHGHGHGHGSGSQKSFKLAPGMHDAPRRQSKRKRAKAR